MTRVDLECPQCGGTVWVERTGEDQTAACEECGQLYDISYDVDQPEDRFPKEQWRLRACEPPDRKEVEGDLRYHAWREEH